MKKFGHLGKVLTKDEQKKIKGGYGEDDGSCAWGRACSLYVDNYWADGSANTFNGTCGHVVGGTTCLCVTDFGTYTPSSGTSHCVV